jgi:hypothetical protein
MFQLAINTYLEHSYSIYIFQVFYIPKNLRNFISLESLNSYQSKSFSTKVFEEHIQAFTLREMDVYICGWIKNDSTVQGSFGVKNASTGANYRKYAKMLIRDSNNPQNFSAEY